MAMYVLSHEVDDEQETYNQDDEYFLRRTEAGRRSSTS